MKQLMMMVLLGISLSARTQHSLIFDVPNTPVLLRQNQVTEIYITEKLDSQMTLTNKYFIQDGYAYEHNYFDPYFQGDGFVMEKSWRSKDTAGVVYYSRGIYTEEGVLQYYTHYYQQHYNRSNQITYSLQKEFTDYTTIRILYFDTLHPAWQNRLEMRVYAGDTLYAMGDYYDEDQGVHWKKVKNKGTWVEEERSITTYKDHRIETYKLYKYGKLTENYQYDPDKDNKGTDPDEKEYGLPIPDPVVKTFYTNDFEVIDIKEVKKGKAKFKLLVHYQNGEGSEPYYEFFDNKTGLILSRFGKDKSFYTEFSYVIKK